MTAAEKARLIVVEIFDDKNAPNREPFAVHAIETALLEARRESLEEAAKECERAFGSPKMTPICSEAAAHCAALIRAKKGELK